MPGKDDFKPSAPAAEEEKELEYVRPKVAPTIKDALKELVVAFGGADDASEVDGNKITEVMARLKTAIVDSGATEKELPKATTEDVGKAVMVGNTGAYELAKVGGVTPIVATFTTNSCDKTFAELKAAYKAGTLIFAFMEDTKGAVYAPMFLFNENTIRAQALVEYQKVGTAIYIRQVIFELGYGGGNYTSNAWSVEATTL